MRRLGNVPDRDSGEIIRDYLYTQGAKTELLRDGAEWALWIEDEDRLLMAKEALAKYLANPADPLYTAVQATADAQREAKLKEDIAARKRQIRVAERWAGLQRHFPITVMLTVMSVWVGMLANLGKPPEKYAPLYFSECEFDLAEGKVGYNEMSTTFRQGQFYRWITPILIHFGPAHLVMNMLGLWQFGQAIERRSGTSRFLGIVVVIALISNTGQYFMSGPMFGGMSGVVFGLFGFLWMKSRFAPDYGVFVGRDYVIRFMFFAVLMTTGLAGRIANTAHFSGLATGMVLALIPIVPRLWKQSQRRRNLP